ncbi:MAG TPA: glycosyltransferase family 39 protein [Methanomicrobiales archaeon]|nr:glycosyltransferase family 39 protein [Methanomicrobiales archaeon]
MAGKKPGLDRSAAVDLAVVLLCYTGVAALIAVLMYLVSGSGSAWLTFDADRFHSMAEVIIGGFKPYIDFVDPKPPLLFFTVSLMDLLAPAGSVDIIVMSAVNVICAILIYWIGRNDYGNISGFSAGLLFLVAAVFVQGYFLFSEQFAVLFLILAFMLGRNEHLASAGLCLGLAMGFKQYAFLAIPPLLFLAKVKGDRRILGYVEFLVPAVMVFFAVFGALYLAYGPDTTRSAINWTFGIAPSYVTGNLVEVPAYQPDNVLAFTANLLASVMMVLPTLLFAGTSIWRRGLRTDDEYAFGLFIIFFLGTLLIRQYLHYWILMLPFLVLLACREFAVGSARASDESPEGSVIRRFAGFAREVGSSPGPRSGEGGDGSAEGKIVFSAPATGSPPPAAGRKVQGGLIPYRPGKGRDAREGEGRKEVERSGEPEKKDG